MQLNNNPIDSDKNFTERWFNTYLLDNLDLSSPTLPHTLRILRIIENISKSTFKPSEEETNAFFSYLEKNHILSAKHYIKFPEQLHLLCRTVDKSTQPFFISLLIQGSKEILNYQWFARAVEAENVHLLNALCSPSVKVFLTYKQMVTLLTDAIPRFQTELLKPLIELAERTISSRENYVGILGNILLITLALLDQHPAHEEELTRMAMLLMQRGGIDLFRVDANCSNAFHLACKHGSLGLVQWMLECVNPSGVINIPTKLKSSREEENMTPLMLACSNKRHGVGIIKLLLANGATTECFISGNKEKSLLSLAIENNHVELAIKVLKEQRDQIFYYLSRAEIPLLASCSLGRSEIAGELLDSGAWVDNGKNKPKPKILLLAASNCTESVVRKILARDCTLLDETNMRNQSPLTLAIAGGKMDSAQFLIEQGARIRPIDFLKACERGLTELVQTMLKRDPQLINSIGTKGQTPLHSAISSMHQDLALFLLELKTSASAREMLEACSKGMQEVTMKILETDPTLIESSDLNGKKPLYLAVEHGFESLSIKLIESGAPLQANEIVIACQKGLTTVVRKMLDKNPSLLNAKSEKQEATPLGVAVEYENENLAIELLEMGAEADKLDFWYSCTGFLINAAKIIHEKFPNLIKEKTPHGNTYLFDTLRSNANPQMTEEMALFILELGDHASLKELMTASSKDCVKVVEKILQNKQIQEEFSHSLKELGAKTPHLFKETSQRILRKLYPFMQEIPATLSLNYQPNAPYDTKTAITLVDDDFSLVVDRKILERSPYYHTALNGQFIESTQNCFDIPPELSDHRDNFPDYIEYLYRREIVITHDNFWGLYNIAKYFSELELSDQVEAWVMLHPECSDYPFKVQTDGGKAELQPNEVNSGKEEE